MNKIKLYGSIMLSNLMIGSTMYTIDLAQNIFYNPLDNRRINQYFSNPYDAESYIDTNQSLSMESYIRSNIHAFPGPLKEGSVQVYPFPQLQAKTQIYFQPCDGSMTNGLYTLTDRIAVTAVASYHNVILCDATLQPPTRNKQGQYQDTQGKTYDPIGSVIVPAPDASPSDATIILLFGQKISDPKQKMPLNQTPIQTYTSTNE